MKKNLNEGWSFHQPGQELSYPANVPGTVHTDLIANGIIEDPYYRTNEKDQQWIDKVDWEYWTEFEVGDKWLEKDIIELDFKGLDTYADVYLNDELILEADNFFLSWKVDVKGKLQSGKNKLRIYFHSPIKVGLRKLADHGYLLPAVNDQSENGGMGEQRVSIFLRKPGYHFGWDWGPRLVPSGIWNDVSLSAYDHGQLHDLWIQQEAISKKTAELKAELSFESNESKTFEIQVWNGEELLKTENIAAQIGLNNFSVPFEIKKPTLWWTHDLGEPHLYDLEVKILHAGQSVDSKSHKIGLRTVKLIIEKDKKGSSFAFELNGIRVFAKGANYIPNDVFIPRVSAEQYENIVESSVKANMNMLRIWGGGFYEKDIFYKLCDEKGIMLWQDFMFACSMYPGDTEFLENVKREAKEQVLRLRNHPSIVLWCGNNEIDAAWSQFDEKSGWGWKQLYNKMQRKEIWKAYDTVFHHILPEVVGTYQPELAYWPSSPYAKKGKHASYSTSDGDIHYWGVWHGEHPFSDFKNYVGRFMSEYGFQSFPEFNTVKSYTIKEDYDIESEVMAAHQRSGIGNLRIRSYMEAHYEVPKDFEELLYVGQLLQAEGIRQAIEAHRGAMPYCMGTLYWQINDCWPVASWSSMDYYQRWKALHYKVRESFEPMLIIANEKDDMLEVDVVSDLLEDNKAKLELILFDFEGNELTKEMVKANIEAQSVSKIYKSSLRKWKKNPEKQFLLIRLTDKEDVLSEKIHYFASPKDLDLPNLKEELIKSVKKDGDKFQISLQSNDLAKNVFLELDAEGWWDQNFMDLMPGEELLVNFYPKDLKLNLKKKDIRVRTLNP
ncbi:MAG: glycoside hydrolase family 2 protein [Bacteroidia bacterium]|nr:glycoside hydrolase family 2 protein [Bacteroidia bacterium]